MFSPGERSAERCRTRSTPTLLALAVVLAILVVACGGGTGPTGTAAETAANSRGDAGANAFPERSVPAVLAADGRFEALLQLLHDDAPALLGFMANERFNGTVFAPTDKAFELLGAGVMHDLRAHEVAPGTSALVLVLQHHIVAGQWPSSELKTRDTVGPGKTEPVGGHGYPVGIHLERGKINVDGATVIQADIRASNGLIHVIDGVMIPDELELP